MAASLPVLRRLKVWWRCNRDKSSIFPLACAPAHARCSGVSARRAERVLLTCIQPASHSEAATGLAAFISEIHRVRFRARVFVSEQPELLSLRNRRANAVERFSLGKR